MVTGLAGVCSFFGLDFDDVFKISKTPDDKRYNIFFVPKKSGGKRRIAEPCPELKYIQKRIASVLMQKYGKRISQCAYAYLPKKSVKQNAEYHFAHAGFVGKIDLSNFFDSIQGIRIVGLASTVFGFDKKAAFAFSYLVTYKGLLPQGSPCSPVLSNMICLSMDRKIKRYADYHRCRYSRYADDIVFSSNNQKDLSSIIRYDESTKLCVIDPKLLAIIESSGFTVNFKKVHVRDKNHSQMITGLLVNKKVNVPRTYVSRLRSALHHASFMDDAEKKKVRNTILGRVTYLGYIRGHDDLVWQKYAKIFNSVFGSHFVDADFKSGEIEAAIKYVASVHVSGGKDGTAFFVQNHLVTSYHVLQIENESKMLTSFSIRFMDCPNPFPIEVVAFCITNGLVICRIKNLERFYNRQLRLATEPLNESDTNKPLLISGFPKRPRKNSKPICAHTTLLAVDEPTAFFPRCGMVEKDKIYGGMSGGPVIDLESFRVVGVNFSGDPLQIALPNDQTDTKCSFSLLWRENLSGPWTNVPEGAIEVEAKSDW